MMQGDYKTTSVPLINSHYSVTGEPSFRSVAAKGACYAPGAGKNGRGGYGLGKYDTKNSKTMSKHYGRGMASAKSAGNEGSKKDKYS